MNVLCQKNYMIQVKNSMLLHFTHKDICIALKDLNELFESGKEYGKTEEELCNELGEPKDFVNKLLCDSYRDNFFYSLFAYVTIALAICVFAVYNFSPLNPVYWCIPIVVIPAYTWHLCGGACLYKIQNNLNECKIVHVILGIVAFASIIVQQFLVLLLNSSEKIIDSINFTSCLLMTFYLSIALIAVFILFSALTIYKLYCGDYLSLSTLMLFIGTICSLLSYITYIKSFNGAYTFSSICSLPYSLGIILFLFSFRYLRKKGMK